MDLYVLNTFDGSSDTVASESAASLSLDAGTAAILYVRLQTALASADFPGVLWDAEGSFSVGPPDDFGEIQSGGTTVKAAARISIPALTPGVYDLSVIALVPSGTYAGVYSVQLAISVADASVVGTAAVPVIREDYSSLLNTTYGNAFPAIAGFPLYVQFSATNSPTEWSAPQLPPGLVMDADTGVVQGSITAAGHYQLTVIASNAAGPSASKSFNVAATDPSGALTSPGGSALASAALRLSWLPPEFIDLQFDLGRRIALSGSLASSGGLLKQGDDLLFAVIPTLGGEFLDADVTKIVLTIRRADQLFAEPLAQGTAYDAGADLTPVTVTVDLVDHKYYLLGLTVEEEELEALFADLNARAGDEGAADPLKITVMAEVRVVYDARRINSANLPLTVGQSLTEPAA